MLDSVFTVSFLKELDPTKQYLFTYAPHGLWTWGLWTALISKQFRQLFPNISWRSTASSSFRSMCYNSPSLIER